MKNGFRFARPVVVLILAILGWWTAMLWPHPGEVPPGSPNIAPDVSYGSPWEFGIAMNDVAGGFPCGIDLWKPKYFVIDGLIWAGVFGCGAAVLLWLTRIANPNG